MKTISTMIMNACRELYEYEPYYRQYEWWYLRFIQFFIEAGVPEQGVIGILGKHHVPVAMVKQYGRSTGLIPEVVAQNIMKHSHDTKEYDPLAKIKIRITKNKILEYRKKLEYELRRVWSDPDSLEETIREECYDSSDEYISRMISSGVTAETWAQTLNEI